MFEYLCLREQNYNNPYEILRLDYSDGKLLYKHNGFSLLPEMEGEYQGNPETLVQELEKLHVENWKDSYSDQILCVDGHSWDLSYKQVGKKSKHISGGNAYPENFEAFKCLVYSVLGRGTV